MGYFAPIAQGLATTARRVSLKEIYLKKN